MRTHRRRLPLLLAAAALCAGCDGWRIEKPVVLVTRDDAARYVRTAREAEDADQRLRAVERLADSRYRDHRGTVAALREVALTDQSEAVRRAAIRTLADVEDPIALDTLLITSGAAESPDQETLPPGPDVRWQAVLALDEQVQETELADPEREDVRRAGLWLLTRDEHRDVRIAAARLLRHFQSRDTVQGLAGALDQRDFGVAYEAARSLEHLTGRQFGPDAAQWRAFMDQTDDWFARADDAEESEDKRWWWPFG